MKMKSTQKTNYLHSKKKYLIFILTIIGALLFAIAPYIHIYFKDENLSKLSRQYKKEHLEASKLNPKRKNLIKKLKDNPKDEPLLLEFLATETRFNELKEQSISTYTEIKKIKANNRIFHFPSKEKFFYSLGFSLFLLYAVFSLGLMLFHKNKTDRLYLLAMKLKIAIIAISATFFMGYTFLPTQDFETYAYIIVILLIASLSLYSSYIFIKYLNQLHDSIDDERQSIVRFIKLIGSIKKNYFFPVAKIATDSDKTQKFVVDRKMEQMDEEINDTLKATI